MTARKCNICEKEFDTGEFGISCPYCKENICWSLPYQDELYIINKIETWR